MKAEALKAWAGRVVVCMASGPSLEGDDVERVQAAGHPVIVTNATFRAAPWAAVVLGHDLRFWRHYGKEAAAMCQGLRVCNSRQAEIFGAIPLVSLGLVKTFGNSGTDAISLAVYSKASRVVLLGFDCQFGRDGRRHWHADHPAGMSNCRSLPDWPAKFERVARHAKERGVPVVNASRDTALRCFPRVSLEEALA